ncbi:alpha/beta fold hydrolase [Nocardia sp. NPDC050799]|uniref:alpha/beta fold hydrolase n=1 Tax=Nocardia sp. NPDC050799 TaxID=3154842 RepID=UPI0033F52F4E
MSETGRTVDVHGIPTHYHDAGNGPVVLLIHGSGPGVTAHANWRPIFPALSQNFRVIAPDMLGFGYTAIPDDMTFTMDTWLSHLTGFLDALDIEECAIVGNSFGGAVALHLTARQPERVRRIVLMGSSGISFPLTPGLDAVWGYEPSRDAMREMLRLFAFRNDLVGDELVEDRYQASMRPGVQEAYSAMFPPPRQHSIDALALPETAFGNITCETLLIHGWDDRIVPVDVSRRLAELLPHARLHIISECGHWVQIEKADEFRTLVSDFLGTDLTDTSSAAVTGGAPTPSHHTGVADSALHQ